MDPAMLRQMRGFSDFRTFNNLVLKNTLGLHYPSRGLTRQSLDRKHRNQTDFILVGRRFQSGANFYRKRGFPGAGIGSNHYLVMTIFRVRLKKSKQPTQSRPRCDLEKLRNPDIAGILQATEGGNVHQSSS